MIKNEVKKILNKLKIVTNPVNRNDRTGFINYGACIFQSFVR